MQKKLNNKPLISIIIPVYNESRNISKCLDSLLTQTYKNIEIIVANDGSTDSTERICKKYRIKLLNLSHGGPGRAKNIAVQKSKGDILVFIDGDMYLDKYYIQNITKPIIQNSCIGTYTTSEFVENTNNPWAKCWNINIDLNINRRIKKSTKKGIAFRAIKKSEFIKTTGYDSKWGYTDDGSLKRFGLYSFPVNNAICYHQNPDSMLEVFFSARWIGRSVDFPRSIRYLLKYSFINSVRIAYRKIQNGAPLFYLLFKVVFDFGIFTGLLLKNETQNYAK